MITQISQQERYQQLLTQYVQSEHNKGRIKKALQEGKTIFPLDLDHMRQNSDAALVEELRLNPLPYFRHVAKALTQLVEQLRPELGGALYDDTVKKVDTVRRPPRYQVTLEGNLGRNLVTPRGLQASLVNSFVGVQGIVTKVTVPKPKMLESVHGTLNHSNFMHKEYPDELDLTAPPNPNQSRTIPLKNKEGEPMNCVYGKSLLVQYQKLVVQEFPEKAPTGVLPRSVDVELEGELVDLVKPGDRVQVNGIFAGFATGRTFASGFMQTRLVATSLSRLREEEYGEDADESSRKVVKMIKDFEKSLRERKLNVLDFIARSVAPSIYGHEHIKKGLLLQLLGGTEKNVNNMHFRGDINILMIGDPSTAKSQMLRYMQSIAPISINTTGRGSSGVGLTAAVRVDRDTGERSLEAGAMVLADRGIICIDEFDKMDEGDRVAIHEAMEQQTVTIAKAGILSQLNARCSVLAAANPIYGEYQRDLPPTRNIGMPDSLLSRFDLLFIVLDNKASETLDGKIAQRVTRNHMYQSASESAAGGGSAQQARQIKADNLYYDDDQDNYAVEPALRNARQDELRVYEDKNRLLEYEEQSILTQNFLKHYINYAKKTVKPQLTAEANIYIAKKFTKYRKNEDTANKEAGVRTLPITTRICGALERLATAHAKLRLSKHIEKIDCREAHRLLSIALYGDKEERQKRQTEEGEEEDEEASQEQVSKEKDESYNPRGGKKRTGRKTEMEIEEAQVQKEEQERKQQRQLLNIKNEERRKTRQQEQKSQSEAKPQLPKTTSQQQRQSVNAARPTIKSDDLALQQQQLVQGVRKIKINEAEVEAEFVLDQQIIAGLQITREKKNLVFRAIAGLLNPQGVTARQSVTFDEVWEVVKRDLANKNYLAKILQELEDKFTIEWDSKPIMIYSA